VGYEFSVLDATSFTNWHRTINGFHLITRISRETVYPAGITNDTFNPIPNTRDVIVEGNGFILADRWYDVNGVYRIAYKKGYIPLIKPQRTRWKGYWRRKGRKVYSREWRRYRQRGRGESVFGSLTMNSVIG